MIANLLGFGVKREGRKFLKLSQDYTQDILKDLNPDQTNQIPLYVHIPFCRTLCPFCCFNRYLYREDRARSYFRSLKKELDLYIQKGYKFDNVYFGGGTPTILMDELLGFIDYLKSNFELKEISLETTPSEISRENVALLKSAGIKRLSIGVQSFDNDILKAMGRLHHTSEEARERLLLAQGNFATLNVDFIFNFPFQTPDKFEADVATFKNLAIDQATFYPLMPSPHKKEALERRFERVDNSLERTYYNIILRELFTKGYRASTVWCFSRGERMIDEYIINSADYIGIGSGSVSSVKGVFYVNAFSLENYEGMLENNRLPIARWRRLSEREYLRYYLLTKLFGTTVSLAHFRHTFNSDIHDKLRSELLFLKLSGVIAEDGVIRVTKRGMYPVSVMMREFFAALNSLREYCIRNKI